MSSAAPIAPPSFAFEGVVRLTRVGTSFIVFTIVVGFAALNTGNNALYIGLTFMLACLLLSGIASKGGLKHLEVEVLDVGEAWAARPADGMLLVRNLSRIWNVRDVVIASPEIAEPLLVPLLARGGRGEFRARFIFARRGRVTLKSIDLYTRYPFGFFTKKRRVPIRSEVVVFPRLLPETLTRDRFRPTLGEQTSLGRPGAGTEILSFRDFVRGDSLRHVYWKKSASLGRWIIKQMDLDAARTVHVLVDTYRPRNASEEDFEAMISEAATFVYQALQRGLDVVLALPRAVLRAKSGAGADAIFQALALIEASHEPVYQTIERETIVFSVAEGETGAART